MSTEEKQTTQTNYLNKFPNEIWLEIFTIALGSFSSDSPYRLQTFTLDIDPTLALFHLLQNYCWKLLTLSKRLYPIIEQLLFRYVTLKGSIRYEKFMVRAKTQSEDHKNRGDWTRALKVDSSYRNPITTSLYAVVLACPNLRLLEIGSMVEINLGKTMEMDDWSSNIRYLYWADWDLTWDHLHKLSTQLPQLIQLGLIHCKEDNQCDSTITFPHVRYFAVSSHCAEHFEMSKLHMPSLESVTIELGSSERDDQIDAFLKQHGARIKALKFVPIEELSEPLMLSPLSDGLFTICSALEEFSFISPMFGPLEIAEEIPAASSSLQTLRMVVEDPDEFSLEQHADYFSHDRFPNITRIIVMPHWRATEEVYSRLKGLFAHATVEMEY